MIDEMTLTQVEELAGYWHKHPPVHLLVAGFVGYRAEDTSSMRDEPTELPPELFMMPAWPPGCCRRTCRNRHSTSRS